MVTNFMLEHRSLMAVALLSIAVVCAGVGYLLLRAPRHGQVILWVLVSVSVVPVLVMTFSPALGRSFVFCTYQFSLPTLRSVELLANVALFVPLVFFATLATRRPLLMLAGGMVVSAAIELTQGAVPAIGRSCDTDDWVMNTAGTVLAVLLASGTAALARSRGARPARPRG